MQNRTVNLGTILFFLYKLLYAAHAMQVEYVSERAKLEQEIENSLKTCKQRALVYAIPSLLAAAGTLSVENGKKVFSKLLLPNKRRWQEAIENLRSFDAQDDFRGARIYTDQILEIASSLPQNLRSKAYYPFAGTDVFWAAAFEMLLFEDVNYNSLNDNGGLWGSTTDYSLVNLNRLINQFKNAGVINEGHEVTFLSQNSRVTSLENDLNSPETTLICKGGCGFRCILPRFNDDGLKFGAVVIVNDRMSVDGLDSLLDSLDYHRVATLQPEKTVTGWAIPIRDVSIFLKTDV